MLPFRFDPDAHVYTDLEGEQLPNITKLLELGGFVEPWWYTEESKRRGTAVHKAAAEYDLGVLNPDDYRGEYRGWLLAHVDAMRVLPHTWEQVEEGIAHVTYRFAGTPDRVGALWGLRSIVDLKSGAPERAHPIQTALQAMLAAQGSAIPAEAWSRYGLYLRSDGRWKLEQHKDPADFREAHRLIRRFC